MTHSCELENFSGEVFKDGCNIDGSLRSNSHLILGVVFQETLDTTAGELEQSKKLACAVDRECAQNVVCYPKPRDGKKKFLEQK